MSFRVDMQDHASYSDPRVSRYHFLRFSDRAWALVNSPLGYQNRLRLPDYRRLFAEAGLDILAESVGTASYEHLAELARVPLAERFRRLPREDVAARTLEVVLRPRSPDRAEKLGDVGGSGAARVGSRAGP